MTSKQIVNDVLNHFKIHPGYIQTDTNNYYSYKKLRKAIRDCLKQAMTDGYEKGCQDTKAFELFDKTLISGKED